MSGTTEGRNGSFKGMQVGDLLLFDPALHRHDRGWPHPPPSQSEESRRLPNDKAPKRVWKTVGILHFLHPEEDVKDPAPGNADFC